MQDVPMIPDGFDHDAYNWLLYLVTRSLAYSLLSVVIAAILLSACSACNLGLMPMALEDVWELFLTMVLTCIVNSLMTVLVCLHSFQGKVY